jgi:hypothetical protein
MFHISQSSSFQSIVLNTDELIFYARRRLQFCLIHHIQTGSKTQTPSPTSFPRLKRAERDVNTIHVLFKLEAHVKNPFSLTY